MRTIKKTYVMYQVVATNGVKVITVENEDQGTARRQMVELMLKETNVKFNGKLKGIQIKTYEYRKATNDIEGCYTLSRIYNDGFYTLNKKKSKWTFNGFEFSFNTIEKEVEVELKPITEEELARMGYYLEAK